MSLVEELNVLSQKGVKTLAVLNLNFLNNHLNKFLNGESSIVKIVGHAEQMMSTSDKDFGGIIKEAMNRSNVTDDGKTLELLSNDCKAELKKVNNGREFSFGWYSGSSKMPLNIMIKHGHVSADPVNIDDLVDEFDAEPNRDGVPECLIVKENMYETFEKSGSMMLIVKIPDNKRVRSIEPKNKITNITSVMKLLNNDSVVSFLKNKNVNIKCEYAVSEVIINEVDKPISPLRRKLDSLGVSIQYDGNRHYSTTLKIVNKRSVGIAKKRAKHRQDNLGVFVKDKYYTPYIYNGFNLALNIIKSIMFNKFNVRMDSVNNNDYNNMILRYWDMWFNSGINIKKFVSKQDMKKVNDFLSKVRIDMKKLKKINGLILMTKSHIKHIDETNSLSHVKTNAKADTKKAFRLFL